MFLIWQVLPNGPSHVKAQQVPITSSGLSTQISPPINLPNNVTQYNITGGTRPDNGPNLFHSFGEFGIPTANIANFLNETALPTSNILGRVTGGNVSNISGTIQTEGFGSANFFLLNPAGFLFGPNATVNVGGMVAFTTADYLRLDEIGGSNAGIFQADSTQPSVLTSAPVAAFGFLGSNPGAITVQGSQFTVSENQGISLVGADITIEAGTLDDGTVQPAKLSAPGGQINLTSVASPGEDLHPSLDSGPNTNGQSFSDMGTVDLSGGSTLDVSADATGMVSIRSGQFMMNQATISANTTNSNGAPVSIDIQTTDNISIAIVDVPALTARTTGTGNAGEIRISSGSMDVSAAAIDSFLYSVIDTHTSGLGEAGNVNIATGDLTVIGEPVNGFTFFVDSGTTGLDGGLGGEVNITARIIQAQDTAISTGNFLALNLGEESTGSSGNLSITADRLEFTNVTLVTDAFSLTSTTGTSGSIALNVDDINLDFSLISSSSQDRSAPIAINTDQFVANNSQVQALTGLTSGGGITINGRIVELTNGSNLSSSTGGDGHAGPIDITATDHLGLLRASTTDRPSGIFSNSFGTLGNLGNSGDITITTPRLDMTGGARINTSTATSGRGGNVTITTDSISMSGEAGDFSPEPLFALGVTQPSGIFTLSVGGQCSGACGNAGNVSVLTGSLTMSTGSQINSGTSSSGQGGNIAITASDTIAMSGTLSTGQAGGIQSRTIGTDPDAGSGGNIILTAGQSFTISDGAGVSASSTGPGNTGNIQINAGNQFAMTDSSVTTEANQAGGGAIKITTDPSGTVHLTNSMISASVLDGAGGGGSVNIDPQFVILQNSQILATAVQGPGGNISITTNLLLTDANSVISASSQFGVNGTVTIQSPNAPASGQIQPLGKTPLEATSLLNQHCAALTGGEFSSFTVAGRDSLPTEPGSWLGSPLATLGMGTREGGLSGLSGLSSLSGVSGVVRAGLAAHQIDQTDQIDKTDQSLLSLRQIAPAGFLTQAFAVDWSAGCQS